MGFNIIYDNKTIAKSSGNQSVIISCAQQSMKSDIMITAVETNNTPSSLPIEISTEAEMTALLETATVGSIYKYIGTTGTYENGALYIVEECDE